MRTGAWCWTDTRVGGPSVTGCGVMDTGGGGGGANIVTGDGGARETVGTGEARCIAGIETELVNVGCVICV